MVAYHDAEWGVPLHDDRALFELLTLEGAQAGLSWLTILRRREAYRRAFHEFDIAIVARFEASDVERLLGDAGLIRNRRKLESVVENARQSVAVADEFGSLDAYLWQLAGGCPVDGRLAEGAAPPATTPVSGGMSRALRGRGFSFVGPTICYAFMQGAGMVNDHTTDCFRHGEICALCG